MEETEGLLLLAVRLDWTSATLVGVVGRDLRAAAAAADDNDVDGSRRIKADAAAVAALGLAVSFVKGCSIVMLALLSQWVVTRYERKRHKDWRRFVRGDAAWSMLVNWFGAGIL